MASRAQFYTDDGGTLYYTLAINPIEYDDPDSYMQQDQTAIDGSTVTIQSTFDSRPRTMVWKNLPNKDPYKNMITQLKNLIHVEGVVLQRRNLGRTGDDTTEIPIEVKNVETKFRGGAGDAQATNYHVWETVTLTYVKRRTS